MDISYENFEEALGQLLPESVRRWHRERQDLGGVGELQLNLCRNGHFSGVCWERESAEREGVLARAAARAGISVEEMLTRTESSPDLPPVPAAPAAASDGYSCLFGTTSTVTTPPVVMELKDWDELSDAERALWHTKESYYSLLKMCHPTHVSAFEDARKARRAADEALVRLAISGHPDASPADAASALDRLLSERVLRSSV